MRVLNTVLVVVGTVVLGNSSVFALDPPPPILHPTSASETALTADEIADKVQATYQGFSDLQGSFLQRATNKLSGMTQEASGRLFLKWPGRMRWEYEKPESRLFLIDGKTLWSYSPSERQAMAQDVSGALATTPIGILFGMSSLRRDFQVRPIVHAGTRNSPESLLELTPKGKELAFKRVVLGIDRESFLIRRLTVFDLYGNTTTVELSKQKVNSDLKDELFQFSPPPGTEVVTPLKPPIP
ncbi:MAG TPA: outer membrane lipoprotein chaperone LolA [Patescibacteria group bacterium]|nr:outer membrane lipoprotein chaperone LolA [Patescibacteria group bacterium]